MKIQNLRIATRLWLGVGALVAVLVLLVSFTAVRANRSQALADTLLTQSEQKVRLAMRWAGITESGVNRAMVNAVTTDPVVTAELARGNDQAVAAVNQLHDELKALPRSEAEQELLQRIAERRKAMLTVDSRIRELKQQGGVAASAGEVRAVMEAAGPYLQALRDFVALQERQAQQAREQVAADRRSTILIAAAAVAGIVAALIVLSVLLVRVIRAPLDDAVALANRIAAGDLSRWEPPARRDEFGDLMRALHAMTEALGRTVGQVRSAADHVSTASSQIASGNHDLSARTEQTASNLQQAASSMHQITATVEQSAGSARQANQLASGAAGVAARGGEVVAQVVSTMAEIRAASERMAHIIGVIDGIAFQTNILALNAAVEAARAGEQGRGFAVVASEVRALAQRSADAAREIKQLITASVEKVEGGSQLVAEAGTTMQQIVGSVRDVSRMIGDITVAASEQSTGLGQVNASVAELDRMTQQNSALVEESTAAAQSLKEQAQRLAGIVAMFRIEGAPRLPAA